MTTILPVALLKISSKPSMTSRSEPVKPRRSAFVLSEKQRQHARRAELGEAVQIEGLAVERRLIDLEVAGVHDDAGRRVNRQRQAVRHAVRDAQELDAERADRHASARGATGDQAIADVDAVFLELRLDAARA